MGGFTCTAATPAHEQYRRPGHIHYTAFGHFRIAFFGRAGNIVFIVHACLKLGSNISGTTSLQGSSSIGKFLLLDFENAFRTASQTQTSLGNKLLQLRICHQAQPFPASAIPFQPSSLPGENLASESGVYLVGLFVSFTRQATRYTPHRSGEQFSS